MPNKAIEEGEKILPKWIETLSLNKLFCTKYRHVKNDEDSLLLYCTRRLPFFFLFMLLLNGIYARKLYIKTINMSTGTPRNF